VCPWSGEKKRGREDIARENVIGENFPMQASVARRSPYLSIPHGDDPKVSCISHSTGAWDDRLREINEIRAVRTSEKMGD
jgi:hypothetical protein